MQANASNWSENLLNEIRQIIYSLHQGKNIQQQNEFNTDIIQNG